LKRDLCVSPYGILRRRAPANCDGGFAARRAKAFAPDRHPRAAILLPADVRAALEIGEEDGGRGVGQRVGRHRLGPEAQGDNEDYPKNE